MNQSTNYNFNLPEGTDLVNLLTQLIPNWSSLDTLLKGVEDQAFTNCTEVVSLGVHAITRSNADGKILKWIASANYTAGDTFTVDGNLVSAATASGEALATNAIVSGAVIIAALNADESAMTIFVTGTNVASDSAKLGGELPSYYATASDMSDAQSDITDLDNLMGSTSISAIGDGTVTGAISDINQNLTYKSINGSGVTVANKLQSLMSEFSNLTLRQKMDSILNIGSRYYRFTQYESGAFGGSLETSAGVGVVYVGQLNAGKYAEIDIATNGSVTYTDISTSSDTSVTLYYK